MKTNNVQGRNAALIIGLYLVIKSVVNLIIGGEIGSVFLALIEAALLYTGLQYVNYAIAIILAATMLRYLPGNISNFSSNWFYLLEGIIDLGCAVVLVIGANVKAHFTNKWAELSELMKK